MSLGDSLQVMESLASARLRGKVQCIYNRSAVGIRDVKDGNPFRGQWRIVSTDVWAAKDLDAWRGSPARS